MSKIVLGIIMEGISTRSDGSFKIVLSTQEIDKTQVSDLFSFVNKYSKAMFSDTNISPLEEKMIDETVMQDGKKVKTKSQRLRAILFRVHEHSGSELDFNTWYDNEMDVIISHFKKKLD